METLTMEAVPDLRRLTELDGVYSPSAPGDRVRAARRGAAALRERMLPAAPVPCYLAYDLVRVPYPAKYALRDACRVPTPYIHLLNRLFIVQFPGVDGRLRTLLVSPSDVEANRETPFFKRLAARMKPLGGRVERLVAPVLGSVEAALADAGLSPADVDYVTYDHLHTQDVRRWMGDGARPGLFPNARLLITRVEWEAVADLAQPQLDWYCPDAVRGIPLDRVVLLDDDVLLGDSVALVRTPGHTEGNHSIVVRTPEGLMVTSESGVGPDSYAPLHSRIPGVAEYARSTGMEVVLNGNTLERGLDQYVSMVLEKEIAGPSTRDPRFPNVVTSSELSGWPLFPGIKPTFSFGALRFGRAVSGGGAA